MTDNHQNAVRECLTEEERKQVYEDVFDALWSCYEGFSREEVFDYKAAFWADLTICGKSVQISTDHFRMTGDDLIPSEDGKNVGLTYKEVAAIVGQDVLDEAIDRWVEELCRYEAERWGN